MTSTNGVSGNGDAQWARDLAQKMDTADGKNDGWINASVWNRYVEDMGSSANRIKYRINIKNAIKSLIYYMKTKDVDKEGVNWQDEADNNTQFNKSASDNSWTQQVTVPKGQEEAKEAIKLTVGDDVPNKDKKSDYQKNLDNANSLLVEIAYNTGNKPEIEEIPASENLDGENVKQAVLSSGARIIAVYDDTGEICEVKIDIDGETGTDGNEYNEVCYASDGEAWATTNTNNESGDEDEDWGKVADNINWNMIKALAEKIFGEFWED